jgi:thiol-disulfide isomerase/thioredoxin/YHS domain-containing protein
MALGVLLVAALPIDPLAAETSSNTAWTKDYETALSESARLERPLLLHFHADWCLPCRRMDRDVLNSPELAAQLKQNFVGVKVDADKRPELLKKYGVRSLPADIVIGPDGKVLIQTQGYQEKGNYVARLDRLRGRLAPPTVTLPDETSEGALVKRNQTLEDPLPPANPFPGLDGYSPVSLYTWREWRKGKPEFTAYHKGVSYQLVTKAELDDFNANPDQYVPRLLGCDPVILQKTDRAVPGSTKFGAYFDGALYLFQSVETRDEFKKSPLRFIKTRHVQNADEIERGDIRQSAKPSAPTDPVLK